MEETNYEKKAERALLISVDTGDFDAEASINELAELADTAGAEVIGMIVQKKDAPSPASFVGSGRLNEIASFCHYNDIDIIIADSELSPIQVKNIEDFADVKVVDRTTLILDIFAKRARSAEGKIQ
ncbi:MAG: GTPase HflX, partial [Eubacterium sp.]|nr:GTPase HflX [Eubacterium sp.]